MDLANFTKEYVVENLSQQLNEIEFLKSMYPLENEMKYDHESLESAQKFLDSKLESLPQYIDLSLNIVRNDLKLEIIVNLPNVYPTKLPDIRVLCNQLNRQQETNLNTNLFNYLKENHVGETCIYTAIIWLQDYIDENKDDLKSHLTYCSQNIVEETSRFIRMWIISHHIYDKKKREEIVKIAKDGEITGFCLSGKPGVICFEGPEPRCNDCWRYLKKMNWQKIGVKKVEELESIECKQFQKFEEMFADMSQFAKFMECKGFIHIFNELFGL